MVIHFLWNFTKSLLFWERATVHTMELNTLFPIEGTPFVFSWETKNALWVKIKGVRKKLPPKGKLRMIPKEGKKQITLTTVSLINKETMNFIFYVEPYRREPFKQVEAIGGSLFKNPIEPLGQIPQVGAIHGDTQVIPIARFLKLKQPRANWSKPSPSPRADFLRIKEEAGHYFILKQSTNLNTQKQ